MTNANASVKTEVINNIMMQMSMYVDKDAVDVLQQVLEEQFVFLNVEKITTLPAEIDRGTEEKNRYLIGLYQVKKAEPVSEDLGTVCQVHPEPGRANRQTLHGDG